MTTKGTVQTGTYVIKNVSNGNCANLADGNLGTPLTMDSDEDLQTVKFNVSYLSSKNYTITSYAFPKNEAFASTVPSNGDTVVAKSDNTQWGIKETNTKGNYLIYPITDNTLFWNGENGNKIKLSKDVSDASKWTFTLKQD